MPSSVPHLFSRSDEQTVVQVLRNYGPRHRVWPFPAPDGSLYITVSSVRTCSPPTCALLRSDDFGESWTLVFDFLAADRRHATTGQPYVSRTGLILVPVWDSGYYEFGRTGLAIYRSGDFGATWDCVYFNAHLTYGKHFFPGSRDGELYLCAGLGGGGAHGKVAFTPHMGVLLHSDDSGLNWDVCFQVESPTALYDGVVANDILFATARERQSLFQSDNRGRTWCEVRLPRSARSIATVGSRIAVSSDSAIFVSDNAGHTWTTITCPIRSLVFRYPTGLDDDERHVVMTAVGWRSLLLGTDLLEREWWVAADLSRILGAVSLTRLATLGDFLFLGDEGVAGVLIRVPRVALRRGRPLGYAVRSRQVIHRALARTRLRKGGGTTRGSRGRGDSARLTVLPIVSDRP